MGKNIVYVDSDSFVLNQKIVVEVLVYWSRQMPTSIQPDTTHSHVHIVASSCNENKHKTVHGRLNLK